MPSQAQTALSIIGAVTVAAMLWAEVPTFTIGLVLVAWLGLMVLARQLDEITAELRRLQEWLDRK